MSLVALVDADIIVYRVGYTTENEDEYVARMRCDVTVDGILKAFKFTDAEFYLSDSLENNYRLKIAPDYKANRKDLKKPKHYDLLKEHFIYEWGARISFGMEADDSLGIRQTQLVAESVICSIDKDLLQIPGSHYNFVRNEFRQVSEEEALRLFYLQVLTGDVTDNIQGIYGIGPKKADKLIPEYFQTHEEYCGICYLAYAGMWAKNEKLKSVEDVPVDMRKKLYEAMNVAGKLLHIKRTTEEGCEWNLTKYLSLTSVLPSESTPTTQEATIPFMEPTGQESVGSSTVGRKTDTVAQPTW